MLVGRNHGATNSSGPPLARETIRLGTVTIHRSRGIALSIVEYSNHQCIVYGQYGLFMDRYNRASNES